MKDKILKKIAMIPDKIVIPIVLAFFIGLWIFTGTATRMVIDMWQTLNAGFSVFSTPFGIVLLIAGGITVAVMWIKGRNK